MVRDFEGALEFDEITLLFQPIINIGNGKISGVEALVRWEHPVLGRLSAEELLGAADDAAMSVQLGTYIRAKAMGEAMAWPAAISHLYLSLNVTAADLDDPGFFEDLMSAIGRTGFPIHRLILELTERAAIINLENTLRVVEQLHWKGISVFIDDFGTGFSSLAWLAQLPVAGIKLDRSFTKMMRGSKRERYVVEAAVALAQKLGLRITAEGVEEAMDIGPAFSIGCDSLQGFGISPPLSSEALPAFVAGWAAPSLGGGKVWTMPVCP